MTANRSAEAQCGAVVRLQQLYRDQAPTKARDKENSNPNQDLSGPEGNMLQQEFQSG